MIIVSRMVIYNHHTEHTVIIIMTIRILMIIISMIIGIMSIIVSIKIIVILIVNMILHHHHQHLELYVLHVVPLVFDQSVHLGHASFLFNSYHWEVLLIFDQRQACSCSCCFTWEHGNSMNITR